MYRNISYFYAFILYPANIWNSLLRSNNFLIVLLGFFIYSITSSANSESFTSSFPIWIPFISLSFLISVAKTSKTVLNNRSKSGYPCLVPVLRGNAFRFSPLRIMWAVGYLYIAILFSEKKCSCLTKEVVAMTSKKEIQLFFQATFWLSCFCIHMAKTLQFAKRIKFPASLQAVLSAFSKKLKNTHRARCTFLWEN